MSGIREESGDAADVDPAEAFGVVANETRLDILEALWRAEDRPVAFSELHDSVEMRDSAQFNYHLQQLTDQFVAKTDDGYDLRHAGAQVVRAEHICERCRNELCSPVGLVLLDESVVSAFYEEHGIDLSARPYWTLPWCDDDEYTEVRSADPWRVAVRIPLADERLTVVLDEDLTVVETTRRSCH